ncbi:hypothetical protein ACFY00_37385 [Kitasatospora sp. NPDC001540]|uniref:hypothetical protein n=1 Tax=Kitasatospora sp. NPDC001540 TaxID=3364014 RepID=UPI0036C195AB
MPPHTGRGRPKKSCNRSCESKAYRRTAVERRQDALAAALIPPRGGNDGGPESSPVRAGAQRQELLEAAARIQRIATGYLERIDAIAAQASDDERGVEVLRLLETSLTALSGRMLRLGRAIRYETLHGDGDWSPLAGMPSQQQAPAAPVEPTLVPPRGGNGGGGEDGADGRIVTRGGNAPASPHSPADRPQPVPGPVSAPSGGADLTPPRGGNPANLTPPRGDIQDAPDTAPTPPRGETAAAAPAPEPEPKPKPDPLGLAPIARRGLDLDTTDYASALTEIGPGWEMRGWATEDDLCLIARDDQLVGWSENRDGHGWLALIGLGEPLTYLVDPQDRPLRHTTAHLAAHSIALALRQDPTLDPAQA